MSICGAISVAFRASLLLFVAILSAHAQGYIGSKACAVCHSEIAKSYALTAMAQASGRAADLHLPNGEVRSAKAQVTYSLSWQAGKPQLQFRKQLNDGTTLEGSKVLSYYIGSGSHGRGFIFEEQGQAVSSAGRLLRNRARLGRGAGL